MATSRSYRYTFIGICVILFSLMLMPVSAQTAPTFSSTPTPGSTINVTPSIIDAPEIIIRNTGAAGSELDVSFAGLTGDFMYIGNNITGLTPADDPVSVAVLCGPNATTGTVTLTTNEPNTPDYTYNLVCDTNPPLPTFDSTPAPNSTLSVTLGIGTTGTIDIRNTGVLGSELAVQITDLTGDFIYLGDNIRGLTPADGAVSVAVVCGSATATTGTLSLITNEPGNPSYTYNLVCNLSQPALGISPAPGSTLTLNFSETGRLVYNNIGGAGSSLDVKTVGITGDLIVSYPDYTGLQSFAAPVETGIACLAAPSTGSITLETNEPGNPQYTYNVICEASNNGSQRRKAPTDHMPDVGNGNGSGSNGAIPAAPASPNAGGVPNIPGF